MSKKGNTRTRYYFGEGSADGCGAANTADKGNYSVDSALCTLGMARRSPVYADCARAYAEKWISENEDVWGALVTIAMDEVAHGRRFSLSSLLTQARYSGACCWVDWSLFKLDNNLKPACARIMREQYPEVKPYLEIRRSRCDWQFDEMDK